MLLDLLHRILDVDEEDGPRRLLEVAAEAQDSLRYLVLSLLEQQGAEFGPASQAMLERARVRDAYYRSMAAEMTEELGLAVMKGPVLGRWYPSGVLRAHTDLDLVAPDEAALWRAVERIARREPVELADVALVGSDLVVTMQWESTDPLIDPAYGADISTLAFTGDFDTVPVRAELPSDPVAAGLLAVAEERFQRAFRPRDLLDVAVLDLAPQPPTAELLDVIADHCRGPEVAELLDGAARHVRLNPLGDLRAALPTVVERELARRAEVSRPAASGSVLERLAAGRAAPGYPLGPVRWRKGLSAATVEEFSHGHILRTPIGDYLLTDGTTVSRAAYEAAVEFSEAAA